MKKTLIILMLAAMALSACGTGTDDQAVSYPDPSYPDPGYPEPGSPAEGGLDPAGSTMPSNETFAPLPSDEGMTRGEAYLDDVELLTLESYPPQFMLNIKGNLPNGCYQLRVAASEPDAENKVNVEIYSIADPDQICAQALAPFEVSYPLGTYPSGTYSLWVNGEKVADFQS